MSFAVEIVNGFKYYGKSESDLNKKVVLNHITLKVKRGSIYGLLGPSGCGKTTLLSCIVGNKHLNRGDISVLGAKSKDARTVCTQLGYMPQDTSLVKELTIAELFYYFGRIYDMDDDSIATKCNNLIKLLEISDVNKRVDHCSGGEQRRISFAITTVHSPVLLILDEPTVGLDPLLRERIWKFLLNETLINNLTVILTTHYIEEAKQCSVVGFMRDGILLYEDCPKKIMAHCKVDSLEDAFLHLCVNHKEQKKNSIQAKDNSKSNQCQESNHHGKLRKFTTKKRMKGLLVKNYLQMIRQKPVLVVLLFIPLVQVFNFYWAIGSDPKYLKIGVVNMEVLNQQECENHTFQRSNLSQNECRWKKLSCGFIDSINSNEIKIKYFQNVETAYNESRKKHIEGFIQFLPNFTESLSDVFLNGVHAKNTSIYGTEIRIALDTSHQQISGFLERKLRKSYDKFMTTLLVDCKYPVSLSQLPMKFMPSIYGNMDEPYTRFILPSMVLTLFFFLNSAITGLMFLENRLEGIHDRTIVAGLSQIEVLLSHIITNTFIIAIQCVEVGFAIVVIFRTKFEGSIFTFLVLLALQGYAGLFYGLFLSIACDSYMLAGFLNAGSFLPAITVCGSLWPLEGMPKFLRFIVYFVPFTMPILSARDIMDKGYGIFDFSVAMGLISSIFSIISLFLLSILLLKIKK